MGSFKQLLRPIKIMFILFGIVFIIRSPIRTWLTPPTHIPNEYRVQIEKSQFVGYGLVTAVSDGDTITIDDDETIRFLGMDTPELAHPDIGIREECYGKDAKARLEQLILHKYVYLAKEERNTDKYGRSLRYVFLVDEEKSDQKVLINAYMIGEGFARAYILEQKFRYKELVNELQTRAKSEKRGLWGSCDREKFRW